MSLVIPFLLGTIAFFALYIVQGNLLFLALAVVCLCILLVEIRRAKKPD